MHEFHLYLKIMTELHCSLNTIRGVLVLLVLRIYEYLILLKSTGYVMQQQFNLLNPTGYVMHQQFNLLNPTGYVMHQQFNLLKPTGHVMLQQFNIQQM